MEKLQDIEKTVKSSFANAAVNIKKELSKIDVDVADYGFNVSKIDGGVSVSILVKVNITQK